MKRYYVWLWLIGFVTLILSTGCDRDKIALRKYNKAIRNHDFDAAYEISRNNWYISSKDVFKEELRFIMLESTQDDNTNLRVSLILKNARNDIYFDDDFEEVCNEVLSMALIRNDDDLILMVFTEYPKCAFSAANREAFSLLEKKHPQEWTDIILDGLKADKDNTFIANYPEAMAFLIKQNSKDLSDRIVNSLGGQPNYPSVGVIKRVEYGNNEDNHKLENGQRVKDFRDDYIMAIANYNKMCRVLLNLSITAKNQYLAKRAVSLTMKNAVMSKMDNTYYEISLLETDRQNNKKIYNDAVADGVFK